jgi:hypothetical protein
MTQDQIDVLCLATEHATERDLTDSGITIDPAGARVRGSGSPIGEYLHGYAAKARRADGTLDPDQPCLACGEYMGGFIWGLSHGHGHCRACSWPATLYHFTYNPSDKVQVIVALFQVHPEFVKVGTRR